MHVLKLSACIQMLLPLSRSASVEGDRHDKASKRAAEREAQRAKERAERAAREQRRLGIEDMQVCLSPCSMFKACHVS